MPLLITRDTHFFLWVTPPSYGVWKTLCYLYEKQSVASQIYWLKKLKKLMDLKMKEGTPMSNHLNEFHTLFIQLTVQEVQIQDSMKAMFLLIALPES